MVTGYGNKRGRKRERSPSRSLRRRIAEGVLAWIGDETPTGLAGLGCEKLRYREPYFNDGPFQTRDNANFRTFR